MGEGLATHHFLLSVMNDGGNLQNLPVDRFGGNGCRKQASATRHIAGCLRQVRIRGGIGFGRNGKLLAAILLSVSLPPVSTLIPFYTLYVQLGLTGTLIGLIIVTLTITIPIVAWMLIGFFRNLPPVELLARVDGFSRFYVLTRIIVPMARSGILVAAVIAFLFSWNEYVYAQILVTGSNAVTLPAAMSGFLFQVPEPSQLAASLLLSLLPPFVIAFFLQKHIAEMHLA